MTKTRNYWNRLISTLWFVPAVFVISGVLLGILLIAAEYVLGSPFRFLPAILGVQPSGARDILSVIAASAITVAGTVFSVTIVALTLASTQFSPRVLRNFMRDTGNQSVLGALVGIFAYCIVVLRSIGDGGPNPGSSFVPTAAVFVAVILALAGIGCLIYFIHHAATSIQATTIISLIANETTKEIRDNFPASAEPATIDDESEQLLRRTDPVFVNAAKTGYVQNADISALINLASENNLVVRLQRRIGQFTIEGLPILCLYPRGRGFSPDTGLVHALQKTYQISSFRTVGGDVAFGLRQIVDIALKALSPAINDSTTAITCIDYLTAILVCLARRPSRPTNFYTNGQLRLLVDQQQFEDFFDLAFNQIRQNAKGNVAVILRQLNAINILQIITAELPFDDERRERHELIRNQAQLLYECARKSVKAEADLLTVSRFYQRIEKSIEDPGVKM